MAEARIITPDLGPLQARIDAAAELLGSPTPLLKAFGVVTLGWIGQTFRQGGRPRWKPLTPWTMAGRREGKGSRSPQPLQDNGALRNSFDYRTEARACVVFSNNPTAVFHQDGTRGPYEIRAKNGKALALPMMTGRGDGSGRLRGQKSLAGLGRSQKNAATGGYFVTQPGRNAPARVKARAGKKIAALKEAIFVSKVTHPGLVARPMLPTEDQLLPILDATAKRLMDLALRGKAGAAEVPPT
jgi:phage gpG-like protein